MICSYISGKKKTLHSPISFCPRCSTLSEIYVESVRVLATPKEKRETWNDVKKCWKKIPRNIMA